MKRYLRVRGSTPGPLFIFADQTPISPAASLSHCGYDTTLYTRHSFRIGAATTAAEKGFTVVQIQTLGPWMSTAFRRYIRIRMMHSYDHLFLLTQVRKYRWYPVGIHHITRFFRHQVICFHLFTQVFNYRSSLGQSSLACCAGAECQVDCFCLTFHIILYHCYLSCRLTFSASAELFRHH